MLPVYTRLDHEDGESTYHGADEPLRVEQEHPYSEVTEALIDATFTA